MGVHMSEPDTTGWTLGDVVRLLHLFRSRMRDHAAATAFRDLLAASARKIRSVDRETRWRCELSPNFGDGLKDQATAWA
jgi:hypothetical protein